MIYFLGAQHDLQFQIAEPSAPAIIQSVELNGLSIGVGHTIELLVIYIWENSFSLAHWIFTPFDGFFWISFGGRSEGIFDFICACLSEASIYRSIFHFSPIPKES